MVQLGRAMEESSQYRDKVKSSGSTVVRSKESRSKKNRFTAETKKKIQKQLLCNKNFMNYSAVERYLFFFVMEKGESEFFSRSVLDSGRVISK